MKIYPSILTCLFIIFLLGCKNNKRNSPEEWSTEQISKWIDQQDWLVQTQFKPDSTLNKKEFAIQYNKNKTRWDKAFSFLKEADLTTIDVGIHELDNRDVFVIVSEYNSKDSEGIPFEAHRDYIDIQYVANGSEYLERALISAATIKTPYEKVGDIIFYEAQSNLRLLINPGTFFIFFPNELHRAGIKVEEAVLVKKIVIKIRV